MHSWNQQQLPRALASFQASMRFARDLQGEGLVYTQLQLSGENPAKDVAGTLQEFFPCQRIVHQTRTRDEQGALGAELRQIECWHRAAGLAVEDHIATRRQTIEPFLEGGLGDRIIDHL